MKTPSLLKVVKIIETNEKGQPLVDKNGKEYKRISVQTNGSKVITDEQGNNIKIKVAPRESSFHAYKESYLPSGKMEFGYDFLVGDLVAGDIVKRKVVPYTIVNEETGEEKTVNIASVIVLGEDNSDNWETLVLSAFKQRGFELEIENKNPVIATTNKKVLVEA